jgi:hypothetical protein
VWALLVGVLVAVAGSGGTTWLLGRFEPSIEALQVLRPAAGWVLLNLGYTMLYAVLAGAVTVRMVQREAFRHALVLGAVLVVAVVGWWVMMPVLYRPPFWYQVALVMLVVPATTLGGVLAVRPPVPVVPASVPPVPRQTASARPAVERPVFRSLAEL